MTHRLPTHRTPDGRFRPLGYRPAPHTVRVRYRLRTAHVLAPIPRSQWKEFELIPTAAEVLDQNGFGACNGHAAVTSLFQAREVAGMSPVQLCPWYVYATLCNGVDQGSFIEEALELLSTGINGRLGAPPVGIVPYGTINPRRIPATANAPAKRFRIERGPTLTTFDDLVSATLRRRPFNFSVRAGANFSDLDADGVCGFQPGPGNHAVSSRFGLKRTRRGKWAIPFQNSWTKQWGQNGIGWLVEDHISRQSYFSAYGIVACADDPEDPTNPPVPR